MSDPATSNVPRSSRGARLTVVILVLLLAAVAIYAMWIRKPVPKHLKLALVTWTQDPFWEPLVHGAEKYAMESNVDLVIINSKPTVEDENQHIKEVLDAGVDGIAISPQRCDRSACDSKRHCGQSSDGDV